MSASPGPAPTTDDNRLWERFGSLWRFPSGVTYLNHGSFGPPPLPVRRARQSWQELMDSQPMELFVRRLEPAWHAARRRLAGWLGADPDHLALLPNATEAMNIVAAAFPLGSGDEVVLTDHEYGAVWRIWRRACLRQRAAEPVRAELGLPIASVDQVLESIERAMTRRTRLLVVSHITSPTALILPVREICRLAAERDVAVCIDGPHALAQRDVQLDQLGCDFYTASCHKWLSAPFGSGLLYAAPQHQARVEPLALSWGRLQPNAPSVWHEEFLWNGTRDPSALLAVPAAIDLLEQVGLAAFRARTHQLASETRRRLLAWTGTEPLSPDDASWYAGMVSVPLPRGAPADLQQQLWQRHRIEVPVMQLGDHRLLRVSCHLYTTGGQLDGLLSALEELR